MKSDIFAVSGMKCVHCKANVENALKSLNGVKSAEANIEKAGTKNYRKVIGFLQSSIESRPIAKATNWLEALP